MRTGDVVYSENARGSRLYCEDGYEDNPGYTRITRGKGPEETPYTWLIL